MESKNILIHDLKHVEADLSDEELISVLFILYIKTRPEVVLNCCNSRETGYLTEFAKKNGKWKTLIVEALSIAGIYEIVNNLGISNSEAKNHISRSLTTDRHVKLLFELCDNTAQTTTSKLIECIKADCESSKNSTSTLLEIHLSHLRLRNMLDFDDFKILHKYASEIDDEKLLKFMGKFTKVEQQVDALTRSMSANQINKYKSSKMKVLIINQETFYREANPQLQCLLPRENLK